MPYLIPLLQYFLSVLNAWRSVNEVRGVRETPLRGVGLERLPECDEKDIKEEYVKR